MYKLLAFQNGVFLALLIFLNGMMSNIVGTYNNNLLFQFIGFILIIIVLCVKKNKTKIEFNKIHPMYFLPGILSVVSVVLNNICINNIGISLTIAIGVFGQLVISNIIDHFGLFEKIIHKFNKEKLVGFSIMLLGIIAMIYV